VNIFEIILFIIMMVFLAYTWTPRICPRCKKFKSFYETGVRTKNGLAQYRCRACQHETYSRPGRKWDHEGG
jgi:transposase-like protein